MDSLHACMHVLHGRGSLRMRLLLLLLHSRRCGPACSSRLHVLVQGLQGLHVASLPPVWRGHVGRFKIVSRFRQLALLRLA